MGERDSVTILWTSDPALRDVDPDLYPARSIVLDPADPDALEVAVRAAERGGVVAIVGDAGTTRALELGADEVLRLADAAEAGALSTAIARARVRADARASRDEQLVAEVRRSDGEALELIGAAAAHELNSPLAVAALDCEMLTEALGVVAGVADEVARWAVAPSPPAPDELRRLAAARRTAPATDELFATTVDLAAALRRATQVVRKMSALAEETPPGETTDLAGALWKVESLMRGIVELRASFEVAVQADPCPVAFGRWQLMQTIAALVSNAHDAVVARGEGRGRIEIRLVCQPRTAIVEIADDGIGMTPEVRARAFHPFFTTRRPRGLGLGLTVAAARVRRAGGEILIESDHGAGTRVRVFLPTEDRPRGEPSKPEGN